MEPPGLLQAACCQGALLSFAFYLCTQCYMIYISCLKSWLALMLAGLSVCVQESCRCMILKVFGAAVHNMIQSRCMPMTTPSSYYMDHLLMPIGMSTVDRAV